MYIEATKYAPHSKNTKSFWSSESQFSLMDFLLDWIFMILLLGRKLWTKYRHIELWTKYRQIKLWTKYRHIELSIKLHTILCAEFRTRKGFIYFKTLKILIDTSSSLVINLQSKLICKKYTGLYHSLSKSLLLCSVKCAHVLRILKIFP
jgi:hypothetical protein